MAYTYITIDKWLTVGWPNLKVLQYDLIFQIIGIGTPVNHLKWLAWNELNDWETMEPSLVYICHITHQSDIHNGCSPKK